MINKTVVHAVRFRVNPFGGWYAEYLDEKGRPIEEKYYLGYPRWWFKVVAKRALRKAPIFNGTIYTREDG